MPHIDNEDEDDEDEGDDVDGDDDDDGDDVEGDHEEEPAGPLQARRGLPSWRRATDVDHMVMQHSL